jgi:hypothetical protein
MKFYLFFCVRLFAMIVLNPENKEIHAAIGKALDAYASVEGAHVRVLESILKITPREAAIVLFSVQNARSRYEMIQELLKINHQEKYAKFWAGCQSFLLKLASYRNALVHWHHIMVVYMDKSGKFDGQSHELQDPWGGAYYDEIKASDVPAFDKDCRYIEQEIHALKRDLDGEPLERASPNRFLKPNLRQNLAVLPVRPKPKEPKAPRPPSVPKLSAAQRRAKARKDAREKKRKRPS